jgi:IS1 family transposase/transposase-like protein
MICTNCKHKKYKKYGHDKYGNQRFRCLLCGVSWIQSPPKPLGAMRIDKTKAVLCLRLLLEGNSIRTAERLTGINRNTILNLLALVGSRAMDYWTYHMVGLPANNIQADEIWGFIGCKEKTKNRLGYKEVYGDAYCFTAIERNTKLLVAWHLGKRDGNNAAWFSDKLRRATTGRFQVTTDGYQPYQDVMPNAFMGRVDFAQLIKIYGKQELHGVGRYSPPQIIDTRTKIICGNPAKELICTSHVERQNLNIRMGIRRMTRLTNAFSKKWENHEYHLAIYFLYYNFCRVHQTLKTTPAVAAGLTDKTWSIDRLLDELATKS